ncbi:hypothetical protein Q1695_003573 [Nippostrongylus brasiliensis]|nr:hypothetical protein Q1695_003573 [Nippostrongylus brasiliensis]
MSSERQQPAAELTGQKSADQANDSAKHARIVQRKTLALLSAIDARTTRELQEVEFIAEDVSNMKNTLRYILARVDKLTNPVERKQRQATERPWSKSPEESTSSKAQQLPPHDCPKCTFCEPCHYSCH